MANAKEIVGRYLGAAQKHPNNRAEIFRDGAYAFIGMAQDPKNARASAKLAKIALGFANQATAERPPTMNDFNDLLRETHDAFHEVGDNPPNDEDALIGGDDPMDLIARRSEIQAARTVVHPGQVSIAPETFDDKATLGRSALITFAPTNDQINQGIVNYQTVAFWQGKKKEAQAMTVDASLGVLPPIMASADGPGLSINNRPYVEVEFGSDGNRNKVQYDLGTGRRCTVVGNYIALALGMDPPYGSDFTPPAPYASQVITVGGSIGCFAATSSAPLIRTLYVDQLPRTTSTQYLPIPLRASYLLPIQTSVQVGVTGTLTIYFLDAGGNALTQFHYAQSPAVPQQFTPVPGDAAYVQVENDLVGQAVVNVRLPFQLSL